ncbi:MAG: hypothetical protein FD174_2473 [Geobacteraceae bacterium]|nr:MAG: hypothetical protein FD174_2473 [Geobacteraceae bacterium]
MIRPVTKMLTMIGLIMIGGCATDNMRQGLYEGFRVQSNLQSSPPERVGKPESPNYQDYERLKKERLEH